MRPTTSIHLHHSCWPHESSMGDLFIVLQHFTGTVVGASATQLPFGFGQHGWGLLCTHRGLRLAESGYGNPHPFWLRAPSPECVVRPCPACMVAGADPGSLVAVYV